MTDATPLASEQITQEDREAAWKYRPACYWLGDDTMEKWMAGAYDTAAPVISDFARHRIAALSATPAPSRVVALDEPNCTNDDYLRRKALTEMVAMDEQMEVEHPGWMTGEATPAPSDQDASQAQGERALAIWKRACVGREGYCSSDLQDAAIEAIKQAFREAEAAARAASLPAHYQWSEGNREKFDFGRDSAADAIAALSPAPGATAQDGDRAWDHRYRPLAFGEIIEAGDECRRDNGTWVTGICVGEPAPDPAYTSHRVYRRLKATPTPTIPAGMVAWNGGASAPDDWDSAEPIVLATGYTYRVHETEGDAWWGHSRMSDGSLTGGCIIAYTPLAAAPKQAEQQGVEALRAMSNRATPGPWAWEQCGEKEDAPVVGIAFPGDDPDCKAPYEGEFRDSDAYRMTIAYDWQSCDGHSASSNAAFVVACVNYVRAALAALNAPTGAVEKGEVK